MYTHIYIHVDGADTLSISVDTLLFLNGLVVHKPTRPSREIRVCRTKARFPLPELTGDWFPLPVNTGRVDGRPVSTSRVDSPSTRLVETGRPS